MLPGYVNENIPRQNNNDFESAWKILMKQDDEMVMKRRFEMINYKMDVNFYSKNEKIPENKEIFIYGFKHNGAKKVDNYILIGFESDEKYENDKLFNFWSNKFFFKKRSTENRFQGNGFAF